jgi:hypothetical protein
MKPRTTAKQTAAALALVALCSVAATAAASVGEVVFVAGDVRLTSGEALAKGAAVEVGQTLVTGAGGHAHVRFVDDAFVAVRPQSQLKVEGYQYDPASPQDNRVRFVLQQGSTRLITGKAGQGNARAFRLNTPMAAIGIRGTDFVVQADGDATRVTVQRGAVVMSPFGAGCSADASGPCTGASARQLTAALADTVLEMRGDRAPVLTPLDSIRNAAPLAPALANEPAAPRRGAAAGPDPVAEQAFAITAQERAAASAQEHGAAPAGLTGTAAVAWGRWGERFGALPATPPGYELIGRNDAFVLFRATDPVNLPGTGMVNFRLEQADGFGRLAGTGIAYSPATISNASLQVNFNRSTYVTALDWTFAEQTHRLSSRGEISESGRFVANRAQSNMGISGALSGVDADQAAYLFTRRFEDGTSAVGALRWSR